jgi:TPR repeat protein
MIGGVSASFALKAGAGLLAGVVAGSLGFCFLPRVEPSVLAARPAVEKPIFVVAASASISTSNPSAPPVVAASVPPAPAAAVQTASAAAVQTGVADRGELDKLAAALKARPISRGVTTVAASSAPPPSEEAARFCAQGLVALASGDIAGARLFLKRAAESGDSRALMALGDSYDAPTLTRLGVVGMRGDPDRAHDFYARAAAAGVNAAKERIAALDARGN